MTQGLTSAYAPVHPAIEQARRVLVITLLFVGSYFLAVASQQLVAVVAAKQLGGNEVHVTVGSGPVLAGFNPRGRPVEVRAYWWTEPVVHWKVGLSRTDELIAWSAGMGVNLLLILLGLHDLRHRPGRGLRITILAHTAAIATAVLWAVF